MSNPVVKITWNGHNITSYVISYKRKQSICDGVGTFDLTLPKSVSYSFDVWDEIILYEDNIKKGTYYISQVDRSAPSAELTISCQDGSKLLTDYFIDSSYYINEDGTDNPSYTRTWIEKFLTEAQVSYSFNVSGSGTLLANNTTIGYDSAMSVIQNLLKQSGWYIYFNEDNIAIVGKANVRYKGGLLTDEEIISIKLNVSDKDLRNRAVVYGGAGYYPGTYVSAETSVHTPWDYDSKDKRTIVYTHSGIRTYGYAKHITDILVDKFSRLTTVKTIQLESFYDLKLSDKVNVKNRDVWSGSGVITSIESSGSSNGFTTTIILDERCPRMFAFYVYGDEYVYISTYGNGVWRKPLPSPVWEDYSQGLYGSKEITDLKIKNGILVCVDTDGNAWRRQVGDSAWSKLNYGVVKDYLGNEYGDTVTEVIASAIREDDNSIYLLVRKGNYPDFENWYAWVVELDSFGEKLNSYQISVNDNYTFIAHDIDTNNDNILVTVSDYEAFGWGNNTCIEGFTTYGKFEWDRAWSSPAFEDVSEIEICDGKVYYVGVSYTDHTILNVYIDDHTNDPDLSITRTKSSDYVFSPSGYGVDLKGKIWLDKENNYLYFYTDDGTYVKLIKYDISSDSFSTVWTKEMGFPESSFNGRYYLTFVREERFCTTSSCENNPSDDCTTCHYDIYSKVTDFINDSSTTHYIGEYSNKCTNCTSGGDWDIPPTVSAIRPNIIYGATIVTGGEFDGYPPGYNCQDGEGSFHDDYIPRTYLVTFDTEGNSDITEIFHNWEYNHNYEEVTVETTGSTAIMATGKGRNNYSCLIYNRGNNDFRRWVYGSTDPLCNYTLEDPIYYACTEDLRKGDSIVHAVFGEVPKGVSYCEFTPKISHTTPNQYFSGDYFFYYIKPSLYINDIQFISDDGTELLELKNLPDDYSGGHRKVLEYTDKIYDYIYLIRHVQNVGSSYDIYLDWFDRNLNFVATVYLTRVYDSPGNLEWAYNRDNIVAAKKYIKPTPTTYYYVLNFFEFSNWSEVIAPINLTLLKKPDFEFPETVSENDPIRNTFPFIVLDTTSTPHQLELSNNSYHSTFTYSGIHNDSIRLGFPPSGEMWSMSPYENYVGSGSVNDIRVNNRILETTSGINLLACYEDKLAWTYITTSGSEGWNTIETTSSGYMNKVETSNYYYPNHVFYSTFEPASGLVSSGIVGSGLSVSGVNTFYQRLSSDSIFYDMSIDIPSTRITTIRFDDAH